MKHSMKTMKFYGMGECIFDALCEVFEQRSQQFCNLYDRAKFPTTVKKCRRFKEVAGIFKNWLSKSDWGMPDQPIVR